MTSNRVWIALFGLWILLLSGIASTWIGPPGVLQALRLKALLDTKRHNIDDLQSSVQALEAEAASLEKSKVVQQHEIRTVLGYAADDEIIFDFASHETN